MELILYKFSGNNREINKPEPPSGALTISGHLRESCDIQNPVITVKYNDALLDCNYCKISAFGRPRYYFVKKEINKDTIILHLKEDVLKTFRSEILRARGYMVRSSNGGYYIPDGMIERLTGVEWQYRKFSGGLEEGNSYVLIVGGV